MKLKLRESHESETPNDNTTQDTLITAENLSRDLLKSIYDAAFMETSIDSDGDLILSGNIKCYVLPSDAGDRVNLLAVFRTSDRAGLQSKIEFANRVNNTFVIVRAAVTSSGTIAFGYDVPISGGITRKALVLVTQRFLSIPHQAIGECDADGLFG